MRYPDNCPPRKIPPLVRVGVWVKVRVSFRVGGATRQSPHEENCPPVRVGVWLRISFGVGRGGGAIFLGSNCHRTLLRAIV